jgi:hypothetical protein
VSIIHTGGTPKKSSLFRRSILDKDLTRLVRTGGGGRGPGSLTVKNVYSVLSLGASFIYKYICPVL